MPDRPITIGSPQGLNKIPGVSSIIVTGSDELGRTSTPVPKGVLLFNQDTKELKPSDGATIPGSLPDHQHPFTHAPLIHSHIFGTNEPWLMANPRLWYEPDVINHPELVILDGSDIADDRAEHLSQIYSGTKLLTTSVEHQNGDGFDNDDLLLTVNMYQGFYSPNHLFDEELSISNFANIQDQWLTGSTSLTTAGIATVHFSGGFAYRPTQYIIIPAAGTADVIFKRRPTPKNWALEGSNDGSTWVQLDIRTNEPDENWDPCTGRIFDVTCQDAYPYLRLNITEWNAGDDVALETGLRRLWIMGRKAGSFALPQMVSPHPDFVYVVPYKNLNIGLIHENVGDIGFTSVRSSLIPTYRLIADGRALPKNNRDNSMLFSVIGYTFDHEATLTNFTASEGNISSIGAWTLGIADVNTPAFIEADVAGGGAIGGYKLYTEGTRTPSSWTVEAYNGTVWTTIQSFSDVSTSEFIASNGLFNIDTTIADVACTKIRFNFISWNEGVEPIGTSMVEVYTHPMGDFYIPTVPNHGNDTAYVVRNLTAVDVSPEIIQRLQQNISDLAQAQSTLANRVDALDPNVE